MHQGNEMSVCFSIRELFAQTLPFIHWVGFSDTSSSSSSWQPSSLSSSSSFSRCNNSSSSSICSAFSVRDSSRSHLARRHFQSSHCLKVHTKHGAHVISKLAFLSLCGLCALYLEKFFMTFMFIIKTWLLWKQEHSDLKPLQGSKSSSKREVYSNTVLPQETKKSQPNLTSKAAGQRRTSKTQS